MKAIVLIALLCVPLCVVAEEVQMAPDGTWVAGEPQLAPDGTWVGGDPEMAPDGSWVGIEPEMTQDEIFWGLHERYGEESEGLDSAAY